MATAPLDTAAWQPTPRVCRCGCGGFPIRGEYLRGHYRRATRRLHYQLTTLPADPDPLGTFFPLVATATLEIPALALLRACFTDAWEHRQGCQRRQLDLSCPQCASDREWALTTAALAPIFSFVGMCEVLGFEPDRTRRIFLATAN